MKRKVGMRRRPAKGAIKAVTNVVSSVGGFLKDVPFLGEFTPLNMFSAAMTAYSMIQQRKSRKEESKIAKEQAEEQRRQEQIKTRYAETKARQQRYEQLAKRQYATGEMTAQYGTMGPGTSGITGGIGSVSSQFAQNVGNINLAEGMGQDVSASNVRIGQLQSEGFTQAQTSSGYGQLANLSMNIFGKDANIFQTPELGGGSGGSSNDNIFKSPEIAPPTIA